MDKANAMEGFRRGLSACRDAMHQWRTRWRLSRPYPLQMAEESLGDYGERLAAEYLRRCGYTLLEQSMHTHYGEIDIIASWGKERVVFVEVKTRAVQRSNDGGPSDAVDEEKQRRITQSALVYMKRHGLLETPGRMDVIAVTFDSLTRRPIFRHFENAFEAVGSFQMYS